MKALITGSQGFVGKHLSSELSSHRYKVSGIDLREDESTSYVDLMDRIAIKNYIRMNQPNVLFHLAAQAAIPYSWENPQKTYELNVIGTINLLEAVRLESPTCRIILVGSADQYGVTGCASAISERTVSHPPNPYAASKKAQEEISQVYAKAYSLDICISRSFNHCGPGQNLGFLVPDLCHGIVQVEKGKSPYLKIGNTEAIRDFTDVRDIVRAYRLISEKGLGGETYNVGSGIGRSIREVVDTLIAFASCEIEVQPDSKRMRASDTPVMICDNTKLREHTGWKPTIPFKKTLKDSLKYYRDKV